MVQHSTVWHSMAWHSSMAWHTYCAWPLGSLHSHCAFLTPTLPLVWPPYPLSLPQEPRWSYTGHGGDMMALAWLLCSCSAHCTLTPQHAPLMPTLSCAGPPCPLHGHRAPPVPTLPLTWPPCSFARPLCPSCPRHVLAHPPRPSKRDGARTSVMGTQTGTCHTRVCPVPPRHSLVLAVWPEVALGTLADVAVGGTGSAHAGAPVLAGVEGAGADAAVTKVACGTGHEDGRSWGHAPGSQGRVPSWCPQSPLSLG